MSQHFQYNKHLMINTKLFSSNKHRSPSVKKVRGGVANGVLVGIISGWKIYLAMVTVGLLTTLVAYGINLRDTRLVQYSGTATSAVSVSEPNLVEKDKVGKVIANVNFGVALKQKFPSQIEGDSPCVSIIPLGKTTITMGDEYLAHDVPTVDSIIIKHKGSTSLLPVPPDLDRWVEDSGLKLTLEKASDIGSYVVRLPQKQTESAVAKLINKMIMADGMRPLNPTHGKRVGCVYRYIEANLLGESEELPLKAQSNSFKYQWNLQSDTDGGARFDTAWGLLDSWTHQEKGFYYNKLTASTIAVIDTGTWYDRSSAVSHRKNFRQYTSPVYYKYGTELQNRFLYGDA